MSRKDAILERLAVVLAEFSEVQSSLVEAGEEELAVELQSEVVDPLQEVATDLDVLEEGEEEELEEPAEADEDEEVGEEEEVEGEEEEVTEEDLDQAQGDEDVFEIVEEAEDEEPGEEEMAAEGDEDEEPGEEDGEEGEKQATAKRMKIRKKGGAPLKWLCCGKPGKIRIRKGKMRGKQAWAAWCKYRKGSKTGGMQRIVGRPKTVGKGKSAKLVLGPAPKKIMLGGRAMKTC